VICPAAALTVPNLAQWDDGTVVEFYVHGVLIFDHYAPYGGWAKTAEGTVDPGGATISTHNGDGIELISVYGLVKK
jgi:hypothetical protein